MRMLALCLLTALAAAQQPPLPSGEVQPKTMTATRPVVMFTHLEQAIIAAIDKSDARALKAQLDMGFQYIQPLPTESPLSADQWFDHLKRFKTHAVHQFNQMSVQTVSENAAIVSFVESLKRDDAQYEDTFIVDYWQVADGVWKLKARYACPVKDFPHTAPKPTGKQ